MGPRARAILMLAGAVALLGLGANALITRVTSSWIVDEARHRAELIVAAANAALAQHWRSNAAELPRVLVGLAAVDQVLAVAACGDGPAPLALTERYPAAVTCDRVRLPSGSTSVAGNPPVRHLDGIDGFAVSVIGITNGPNVVGSLVLVHDAALAELHVAQIKSIILAAFALFGLAALVFGLFGGRLLRQSWMREMRLVLGGFSNATEFRALLNDLRTLAARVSTEEDARDEDRTWTPARVKSIVRDSLDGSSIVVLANREPVIHQRGDDGTVRTMRPASGLVSALEPIIRACSGTWVAHGSGSADREFVDDRDRFIVPPTDEAYSLRRVWLTEEQERGYYYGFANEGLWPLCHIAHRQPAFRAWDFERYREVNQLFVDAVCAEATTEDPIVLVQDYHFALAPRMIRERLPHATVMAFWHIPWPNAERLSICPWRVELLHGLLGSTIVGFQTQQHCNNFISGVDAFIEARVDRERDAIVRRGSQSLVRPYPISIEWPQRWTHDAAPPAECRRRIIAKYGLADDALIGFGVDRLDYTKGLEERMLTVERVLERSPEFRGRLTFIQVSAPSRTRIPWYQELSQAVAGQAERINARFGTASYRPIILLREHHEHDSIAEHYRAANVCYVSSVHDGMNLVAKEFVASRDDEQGTLMLSYFAGASRELTEALVVNPYDLDGASDAMVRALTMTPGEQRERMRSMRTQVRESNVFRWAGRLLLDAARERRRARMAERLASVPELRSAV